jgi:predicted RNase H-like nuclease
MWPLLGNNSVNKLQRQGIHTQQQKNCGSNVFCVPCAEAIYNESKREKLVCRESWVGGYQSAVLSCIIKHHYQATTSEQVEDFMCAVVVVI